MNAMKRMAENGARTGGKTSYHTGRRVRKTVDEWVVLNMVDRVTVYGDAKEVTVNVNIKAPLDAATAAQNETASTLEGAFTRGSLYVHQRKQRGSGGRRDEFGADEH